MENNIVAGTFVAAVLEHMGYVTQARFLVEFQDFFRDAGALVYLVAGIGAVVSVAIYGSFRASRYLLLGPAFFWFLVGPTTEVDGVLWRLGSGNYLGELREQGEGPAREFRDKITKKMNEEGKGPLKVATGFWLFAWPINEFVNEMVDKLLFKEDTDDLMASHKTGGLELIASQMPYDTGNVTRMENFAAFCGRMFTSAHAAAGLVAKRRAADVGGAGAGGAGAGGGESRPPITLKFEGPHYDCVAGEKHYEALLEGASEGENLMAKQANALLARMMQQAYCDRIQTANTGFGELIKAHHDKNGESELAKSFWDDGANAPIQSLTCANAWKLVAEEVWHTAGKEETRVLRLATGLYKYEDGKATACNELTRKIFENNGGGDECKIQPGIAAALIYNHFTSVGTWNRVMQRHWNEREGNNPASPNIVTGASQTGFKPYADKKGHQVVGVQYIDGRMQSSILLHRTKEAGAKGDRVTYMWAPLNPITALEGMDHAMWVATRQYETVQLRQKIYTYAMQLPYYQGVSLYLIALLYPFMALVVILPGRAQNFLNIPLAWLWVKSWDIGFAAVVILDKVMFNLLPNWHVDEKLKEGPWFDLELLPMVLAQGYTFDPLGAIHIYYTVVSLVVTSIPLLTGLVTVKARAALLSDFTRAPQQQAANRARMAGTVYSMRAQSHRNHLMKHIKGYARLSGVSGSGGVRGGMKGISGKHLASLSAGGKMYSQTEINKLLKLDSDAIAKLPESLGAALAAYKQTANTLTLAEAQYEGAHRAAFDPILGRHGSLQMFSEAYASAMDGGGGFELTEHTANSHQELTQLLIAKEKAQREGFSSFIATSYAKGASIATGMLPGAGGKGEGLATAIIGTKAVLELAKAGEGEVRLSQVKTLMGADGYTDQEFMSRVFHLDRHMMEDSAIRESFEAARNKFRGSEFKLEALFNDMEAALNARPVPGGPSSTLDLHLAGSGGNRFVGAAPDLVADAIRAQGGTDLQRNTEQLLDARQLELLNLPDAGLKAADRMMKQLYKRDQDIWALQNDTESVRRQFDSRFQAQFGGMGTGGLYSQQVNELRTTLISDYYGGAEKFAAAWNDLIEDKKMSGRRIDIAGGVDISDFSVADLVAFSAAYQKVQHGEMRTHFDAKHAEWTANPEGEGLSKYDELGHFRYRSQLQHGELPSNIAALGNTNPLMALQLIDEWHARTQGRNRGSFNWAPGGERTQSVFSPGDFYKK